MKNDKLKLKRTFLTFFIVILIFSFLIFSSVSAQTSSPLTVAPARQQLALDPGQSSAVNIRFYNMSENPLSGIVKVADFIVDNDKGEPRIIDEVDQADPRFSAQAWFSLPYDRATIASNDQISFQAKIDVPADAHPGGRYVAIYFEPAALLPEAIGSDKEAGTGVASRLAALVYLKINGETVENALVSRFFVPGFFEYGPVNVKTQILNRGDYHIRPRGVITLSNVFGAPVDQTLLKEENIFPDITKDYSNSLGRKYMLGKYKLSLTASYGETGKALEAATYVWIFPWRIALVIILTLIILVLIVNNLYKGLAKKEVSLEKELAKEKEEIDKLKEILRKRE